MFVYVCGECDGILIGTVANNTYKYYILCLYMCVCGECDGIVTGTVANDTYKYYIMCLYVCVVTVMEF